MKEQKQDAQQQSPQNGGIADSKNLNSELIKSSEHGMFKIIEAQETGDIFVAIGRIKLKSYESVEDAKEDIDKKDWDLLISVMTGLIVANEKMKEEDLLLKKNKAPPTKTKSDTIRLVLISM